MGSTTANNKLYNFVIFSTLLLNPINSAWGDAPKSESEQYKSSSLISSDFQKCSQVISLCQKTKQSLDLLDCSIVNSSNIPNSEEHDQSSGTSNMKIHCEILEIYKEKINNLEQEVDKLKRTQQRRKSKFELPSNLNETIQNCKNFILLHKIPSALRQWKLIEDHYFFSQNNFQASFNTLKQIIQQSYNNQRNHVQSLLTFINKLDRPSQKSNAISNLLDFMKSGGHFPGKEIFTVGYFAGRNFDRGHEIWHKFPKPVKLVSTLWRLKWLVKYENQTYTVKFADAVNSPLEILTVNNPNNNNFNQNSINSETPEEAESDSDTETGIEWHFVSTAKWHWLKLIGAQGYVKVDDYSLMLARDPRERDPGEFELHLNKNNGSFDTFSMYWKQLPVLMQIMFKMPFAFVVQDRKSLKLAEFVVEEPRDVEASYVIDLLN